MGALVQLADLTDCAAGWELGRTAAELLEGLPEPVEGSAHPAANVDAGSAAWPPVTVAAYLEILAHIDPTFSGDRAAWFGIMRCIIDGGVLLSLSEGQEAPDGEELAVRWANGDLWRERTGDSTFIASTFRYADDQECLHDVRASEPRTSGSVVRLGTLLRYANLNSYRGRIDNTPAAEVFKDAPAVREALAASAGDAAVCEMISPPICPMSFRDVRRRTVGPVDELVAGLIEQGDSDIPLRARRIAQITPCSPMGPLH
jgi:hypothetical protein